MVSSPNANSRRFSLSSVYERVHGWMWMVSCGYVDSCRTVFDLELLAPKVWDL